MLITTPVAVFDFDNVIVRRSEDIKNEAWDIVFPAESKERERFDEAYGMYAGGSGTRFDVLNYVYESKTHRAELVQKVSAQYEELVGAGICSRGIHPEDVQSLIQLGDRVHLHIISNTPQRILRKYIRFFEIASPNLQGVFHLVLGTPKDKVENLKLVQEHESCGFADITMIGDGENDRCAAEETGCNFIGISVVENEKKWQNMPFLKVSTIAQLGVTK